MRRDEETVREITDMLTNEFKIGAARLRPHDHDPTCEHCVEWMKRFHVWAEDRARHIVAGFGDEPSFDDLGPDPQRGTF